MKPENMKVGMRVVVKKSAQGYASKYIGHVAVLLRTYDMDQVWTVEVGGDCFGVYPDEVRKVREGDLK